MKALLALADRSEAIGEVVNIGSTEEVTILDLAHKVIDQVNDVTGRHSEEAVTLIPYDEAFPVGFEDMRRRVPDISKVRALVGWEPVIPLQETIRRVIASHRGRDA